MLVCIDPGHGGTDTGATFRGALEKDIVLDVALKIPSRVQAVDTILTRNSDVYVPLLQRCTIANWANAAFFLSIHCNADPDNDLPGNPEAKGEEIWVFPSKKSIAIANIISSYVDQIFPDEPFRGVKTSMRLCVLKNTHMPACLVEVGFIDNSKTVRQLQSDEVRTEIASWLAISIMAISHSI